MKVILFLMTLMMALPSLANQCQVNLKDRGYNVRTFRGQEDNSGFCRRPMRLCNQYKKNNGYRNAKCVVRRTSGGGYGRYNHFLNQPNYQVAQAAQFGRVGSCRVERGYANQSCDFYVKVNRAPYPDRFGNGCARREYTSRYGCHNYSEEANAGCLIKIAIRQGQCR